MPYRVEEASLANKNPLSWSNDGLFGELILPGATIEGPKP